MDLWGLQGHQALKALRVHQVSRVMLEILALPGLMVQLEVLGRLVLLGLVELRDQGVILGAREIQDKVDHLVDLALMVIQGSRDLQDP